jgi:glycosyltransferase involved in cell wall biosynthesis
MSYEISVIIPVYNVEKYIKECLDSVVNQSLGIENIEVIIVNDCTPDNSMEIVREYAEKYPSIKILEQKVNQGPGAARNLGLMHVTSDYVTFLDSDDYISLNTYENCLNKFYEDESADLVIYKYVLFDSNGEIDSMDIHQEIYKEDHVITDLNKVPEVIFATAPWNKVYPKKFFSYLNFPDSMLYEDNIVAVKVLLNSNKIVLTTDSIYYYRHGENDSSRTQSVSKRNCVDLLKSNTQLLNLKNDYPNYSKLLYFLTLNFSEDILFWLMNFSFFLEDKKEIYNSLKVFLNLIPNDIFIEFKNIFPNYISTENDLLNIKKMDFYEYLVKYKSVHINSYESILYVDNGKGFNETDKVTMSYQMDDIIDLTFDLKKFKKIRGIRFIPIVKNFCRCSIISILSDCEKLNIINSNSRNSWSDKSQIFTILTPYYLFEGDFTDITYINLKFKVETLSNIEIEKQFILRDKDIDEKNLALKKLNEKINNQKEIINNKNKIIELKDKTIKDMSNSKSWKITKPIRSVKKNFKK